ncbi:armadillo-type protein [Sphaerosporella brunnea]|uniref:Armadillo-type protein n=1 Tax=Sphaerosporella brunnea TaxID=1250544 RepID=A0A5J5ERW5_9PEZI|nr:armadillo-type protein [Sphaerosporella brunnea]
MEQELLVLLQQTQTIDEAPRRAAEAQLETLHLNDAFPIALANIGSASEVPLPSRQAALTALRRYVARCWSDTFEDFQGPLAKAETKSRLRPQLLALATDNQRKVRSIATAIVGKIATSDFPEEWPDLLGLLLNFVTEGSDTQTNGALHILNDVLEEGLGEEQFFALAKQVVELLYKVATNEARSFAVRSLSVCTFKSCIDTLGMMRGSHGDAIDAFAREAWTLWMPFMIGALEAPIASASDEVSKGLVTLKIQVIRTTMEVKRHFPNFFNQDIEKIFGATWTDMNQVKDLYVQEFVQDEAEGRLVDTDGLPCSLDLYVLEQLDFLQGCMSNKVVKEHIERAGFAGANSSPFSLMISTAITLSQIAGEDKTMWEIDLNVFLTEETAISANYTPRTASGDLIMKIGECFPSQTVEALFDHTQRIFSSGESQELKESALHLWDQLLNDYADMGRPIDSGIATSLLGYIVTAISSTDDQSHFLRARGYSVAATLTKATYETVGNRVGELMEQSLRASSGDPSKIVQITALRTFQKYRFAVPVEELQPFQASIIASIRTFLNQKSDDDDPEDSQDVLTELVETVRMAITIHVPVILDDNLQVPQLLFAIAGNGVTNIYLLGLIRDTITDITDTMPEIWVPLCGKVMPLLMPMMDLDPSNSEHPLIGLATNVLDVLLQAGTSPLPPGLVETVMPRISRILLASGETDLVQSGCGAMKEIARLDCEQLLKWRDASGKSGLEISLFIIDRLLRPEFSEGAAMEVGGLAAEIVDKAGDHIGQVLPELLRAVAMRLATAALPTFTQSLILVFARLVLKQPMDVVDFLANLSIGERSGLQVVMTSWLANTTYFSGYEEIRQNSMALCRLYTLEDPRLAQVIVAGDLVVPTSTRIMTRSRAKQTPDQYTMIPVPLKIIKLLIQELGPSVGENARVYNQPTEEYDSEGGEWEDVDDGLNIPGVSREELLALGGSGRTSREVDDETANLLTSFFKEVSSKNIGDFQNLYNALNQEEKQTLSLLR